jgi:hypothetical protein
MIGWQLKWVVQQAHGYIYPVTVDLVDKNVACCRQPEVEPGFPEISGEGGKDQVPTASDPLCVPCEVQVHSRRSACLGVRRVSGEAILANALHMLGTGAMIDHDVLREGL